MPLSGTPIPSAFFVSIKYITPMKSLIHASGELSPFFSPASPRSPRPARLCFNQGPLTGTYGGSWENVTAEQNFADKVSFQANTWVTGYNYFTNYNLSADNGNSAFYLKLYSDSKGLPGCAPLLRPTLVSPVRGSKVVIMATISISLLSFFSADTTYWIGGLGQWFRRRTNLPVNVAGGDVAMPNSPGPASPVCRGLATRLSNSQAKGRRFPIRVHAHLSQASSCHCWRSSKPPLKSACGRKPDTTAFDRRLGLSASPVPFLVASNQPVLWVAQTNRWTNGPRWRPFFLQRGGSWWNR